MTSLINFLINLKRKFTRQRRLRKLDALERDAVAVVERSRRELKPGSMAKIHEKLTQHLDDIDLRLKHRPSDRSVLIYDLTQKNRAARVRNDQAEFSALTLAIIATKAKLINERPGGNDLSQSSFRQSIETLILNAHDG